MNVFIVGSPLTTAMELVTDTKRFNKQIIECKQILNAIDGNSKAWANHPCTLQYKAHRKWLKRYGICLSAYKENRYIKALFYSILANRIRPSFHTAEFFDQMKRRLFTKDNNLYDQWAYLGTSEENFYYVDGEMRVYVNGKRVR